MKKIIFKVTAITALFISTVSFAQGLNKTSLLNELNKTYGIPLNADEKNNFETANSTLVAELLGLEEKNLSKEIRDKEIDKLFDKRDKTLTSTLGINKYSDIKAKTDEKNTETIKKVKQSKIAP